VRNALDALEEKPVGERELMIGTSMQDGRALISVRDNGLGIPPDRMLHLFDPFFTTKETGMGMGLPISQTILENHDGSIWAESTPGVGTTFYVRLPVAATASAGGDAETEPEPEHEQESPLAAGMR